MFDDIMIPLLGAALVVGVIAVCVGPLYYCKRLNQRHDKSDTIDGASPLVHIKISHPHRDQCTNGIGSDASDNRRNSIDLDEAKEMKQVAREAGPVSPEQARNVHVKLPHNGHRVSTGIWSSALRNQLENITNSSSELCGSTKLVRAQIEANPRRRNTKPFDFLPSHCGNSSRRASTQSYLTDEKARKLSSVVKKWKNLKKTLICSSSEQSTLFKDVETDDTQRLSVPVQTINQRSPLEYSATLQKNRLVDVSTSTRISANGSNARTNDEMIVRHDSKMDKNDETSKQSQNDHQSIINSNTEAIQEVVSLIKRQSVNGKSICDLRICGLAMNQAQLLDLFQATEGETRSASIVTTEEASIISIKFHRRRNSNEVSQTKDTSFYECPLWKLYRSLPEIFEDLSISRLFRSQEVSDRSSNRSGHIHVSDHSKSSNNSRNETSYMPFPKFTSRFVTNESICSGGNSLSKRFSNSRTTRFFEERRI